MDNPLKKIFGAFGSKPTSVLGVDIGASAIKVVQLKKKNGRAVLETYGELALGPYAGTQIGRATNLPPQKIVEAISDLLREANITTRDAGIAIPLSSSLVSFISMPALPEKQLAEMIPIEARKYIPVPISEVMLDWSIIPKEKNRFEEIPGSTKGSLERERIDVLLVVIHNEAIGKFQKISQEAALSTSFFEIELFSTIRAAADPAVETQMIFDMGASSTKLYIIERGILRNSHTITRGSQDITLAISKAMNISVEEAEHIKRTQGLEKRVENQDLYDVITLNLDYIFYEANRVLLNYQKKYNKDIGKVVLTGGGVLLKGFGELAKHNFQCDVALGNPFAKAQAPAFLDETLSQAGPEFAVALGVALRKLQELD